MSYSNSQEMPFTGFLKRGCWAAVAGWDLPLEIACYYPWPNQPQVMLVVRDPAQVENCPEPYRGRLSGTPHCHCWTIDVTADLIVAAGPTREDVLHSLRPEGMEQTEAQATFPEGHPDFDPDLGVRAIARRYLNAGLSVLPIDRPGVSGEKARIKCPPGFVSWQASQKTRMSENDFVSFWGRGEPFGIGVACGDASGNLEVIDFDCLETFQRWVSRVETEHPELLSRLVIHQTPADGRHLLYRCGEIGGNTKLARRQDGFIEQDGKKSRNILTLIETRGVGGLIVMPGSPLDTHPSGRPYKIIQGSPETIPTIAPEDRAYLLETARSFNEYDGPDEAREKDTHDGEYEPDSDNPIDDFNQRASFQDILEPKGWSLESGDWEHGRVTLPGKDPRDGASATIGYSDLPILHVFTSSSELEPEANYTKFRLLAVFDHEGDFSAARRAIVEQGFGKEGREFLERRRVEERLEAALAKYEDGVPWDDPDTIEDEEEQPIRPEPQGAVISARSPLPTSRSILAQVWSHEGPVTLHQRGKTWLEWDGRRYRIIEDEDTRRPIWTWLERCRERVSDGEGGVREVPFCPNSKRVNEVMDALRSLCLLPDLNLPRYLGDDPDFPRPENVIAVTNGLLDVEAFLQGREDCLRSHTPLWLSTNVLPYRFVPGATCDRWRWFTDDVMGGDEEAVEFLQKWLGLNLVPDLRHQVIVIGPGSGSNGKGVFTDTAIAMLGEHNVATPTFSSLGERFGRACLLGKLAAFLPDAHLGRDTDSIRVLEFLKSVSGGDPVDIEEKNKPMMTGIRLSTRFTIMVNEMPKLPDASRGIGRRVRIVPFHQSYEGREDRDLRTKLRRELPGILLWALEGLRKLRQDGSLAQPAVGKAMYEEFLADCSPIHTFLRDYCEVGPEHSEDKEQFRKTLNTWLVENGHNTLCATTVTKKLRAANTRIGDGRLREGDKQVRVFTGVKLNPEGKLLLRNDTAMCAGRYA